MSPRAGLVIGGSPIEGDHTASQREFGSRDTLGIPKPSMPAAPFPSIYLIIVVGAQGLEPWTR